MFSTTGTHEECEIIHHQHGLGCKSFFDVISNFSSSNTQPTQSTLNPLPLHPLTISTPHPSITTMMAHITMNLCMTQIFMRGMSESTTRQPPHTNTRLCLAALLRHQPMLSSPSWSACSLMCTTMSVTDSSTFDDANLNAMNVFKPPQTLANPHMCLAGGVNDEPVDEFHTLLEQSPDCDTDDPSKLDHLVNCKDSPCDTANPRNWHNDIHDNVCVLSTLVVPLSLTQDTNTSSTAASRGQSCTFAQFSLKQLSVVIKPSSQKGTA